MYNYKIMQASNHENDKPGCVGFAKTKTQAREKLQDWKDSMTSRAAKRLSSNKDFCAFELGHTLISTWIEKCTEQDKAYLSSLPAYAFID